MNRHAPLHNQNPNKPQLSVSLAFGIGSLRSIYEAWKAGNLTKAMLTDIPGTGNIDAYFSAPKGFSLLSSPRSSFVFTLEGLIGSSSGFFSAVVYWLNVFNYPHAPEFPSGKRALALSLTSEKAPGPTETEGHAPSVVAGASPVSLSARCVAFTVSVV